MTGVLNSFEVFIEQERYEKTEEKKNMWSLLYTKLHARKFNINYYIKEITNLKY